MTLDRDVFCVKQPSVDTFVHELVHVKQYAAVGPVKFLTSYFGEAGYEVLRPLIAQEEIDPVSASAYAKEGDRARGAVQGVARGDRRRPGAATRG